MKIKASMLPLITGIAMAIASLNMPWLTANHYRIIEGVRYSVDSYLFFFWGKYYTVTGSKLSQSYTTVYSLGDFPIYAMVAIAIAILLGAISFFGGRGTILNIKGRELKLRFSMNPIWLLASSSILLILSYIYMKEAAYQVIIPLEMNRYTVEYGPSLDFLLGSIVAFMVTTVMTAVSTIKMQSSQTDVIEEHKSEKVTEKTKILKSFDEED